MTSALTIECRVQFTSRGRGSRKRPRSDQESSAEAGRMPRVSRLLALAIRFDNLIRSGEVSGYADLARLGHVSRARLSQITSLLSLAPDLQEKVLFLPRTLKGRDPIQLRHLLSISAVSDWCRQWVRWKALSH